MATTDPVLIQITTAANMAGIEQANKGLLGLTSGTVAVGVALGVLVGIGKSAIDITEQHDAAQASLTQAVDAYNAAIGKAVPLTAEQAAAQAKAAQASKDAADAAGKAADAVTMANNSQTSAQDAVTKAQLTYTEAVKAHGATSDQAEKAALSLKDANLRLEDSTIRVKSAQDALKDANDKVTATQVIAAPAVAKVAYNMQQAQLFITQFTAANKAFIPSQAEVISSYAAFTKAGVSQVETQQDVNRALDLSALKHISLTDATELLVKAESGHMRGLIDLGITTSKYTDSNGDLVNATKDVGAAMTELDGKLLHGRDSTTKLQQANNTLSNDWQDLALKVGPPLLGMLTGLIQLADWAFTSINNLGYAIDGVNKAIEGGIGGFFSALGSVGNDLTGLLANSPSGINSPGGGGGRAAGGPVSAGTSYLVGERGPELFTPGSSGGITPNGAGGMTVNINIDRGAYIDGPSIDALSLAIARRLSYATGT